MYKVENLLHLDPLLILYDFKENFMAVMILGNTNFVSGGLVSILTL